MPIYTITGSAWYADGFEFTIEADNETQARRIAHINVKGEAGGYKFDPELVEICIETIYARE
jgi:hypothetical protein